jgi:transposase
MATSIGIQMARRSKATRPRARRTRQSVQKARGVIGPRVKKVGADKFALVCVDPAKKRSEWMMADYFGNLLIEPCTLEHQAAPFEIAMQMIRQTQAQHGILDLLVIIERTGNYHLAPQRAFARAGFETRILHPFATKQYRLPADAGNKTDHTDLFAQHRAAIAGFGLQEPEWDDIHRRLQLRTRHRRDLVEKASAVACQLRDHLHLAWPGYAELFADLMAHSAALALVRGCDSPQAILQLGKAGLEQALRGQKIRFQAATLDKVLAWASQAASQACLPQADLHHALAVDLESVYQDLRKRIALIEGQIVSDFVQTPYVRLLAIPGIHVISAADFAGEMGPIAHYPNSNAITGRAGLFPSRYQSDQTDCADGPLVRHANRRLRATLLRIADNLSRFNGHFRGRAGLMRAAKVDERAIRVKIAKNFTRIAYAAVAGPEPLRHPCCADRDSILQKLRSFHLEHGSSLATALADMEASIAQLNPDTRGHEARIVNEVLQQQVQSRRGPARLGELLPAVLARLGVTGADAPTNNHGSTAPD